MTTPKYSFYRPHERVQYTGQLFNEQTGEFYTPPRRVKQSFKDECDINRIVKQFSLTGQIRHMNSKAAQGAYVDLPDDLDFQTALETIRQGENAFATLPSQVRDRFNNDPAAFLGFMADPANQEEIIKLGLATDRRPPKVETPPTVPPAGTGDLKLAD